MTADLDKGYDPMVSAGDPSLLGLDQVEPPAAPRQKQWVSVGIFVLMAIAMVATGLVVTAASDKEASTLGSVQARLEESVRGRTQTLQAWIDRHLISSRRLTRSGLVKLFVTDMALTPVGRPLPRALVDQRPYFQTLMTDFARQNDLLRAAIIDREGRPVISSAGPSIDVPAILAAVETAPPGWTHMILPIRPIRDHDQTFMADLVVPLPLAQAGDGEATSYAGVLIQTLSVNPMLQELLRVAPPRDQAEAAHLLQSNGDRLEMFGRASSTGDIVRTILNTDGAAEPNLEFGRYTMAGGLSVFRLGERVSGLGWALTHGIDARTALSPLRSFVIAASGIAITLVLTISFCFAMVWSRHVHRHHHDLISLYRTLAVRLDRQRQFLAAITASISDWLSVSDNDGRLVYVNAACAKALDLPEETVLGQQQRDLLPLQPLTFDNEILEGLGNRHDIFVLDRGERSLFLATSVSDLCDQQGQPIGQVMVLRDQTEDVEHRQNHHRAMADVISAFVHAIERRDPFLLGHTRRLRSYAIAVGRQLDLDQPTLAGLALAASLSQIGKIFIPDHILTKPIRHDEAESEVMRSHIGHAMSILDRIDFGFPVIDALGQMHERLDGCGYPNGLVDGEISLSGRILGACDVFCARTAPRTYRDRLSAGNALFHLANNAARYDVRVIAALADVVLDGDDVEADEHFDRDFPDSRIWIEHRGKRQSEMAAA